MTRSLAVNVSSCAARCTDTTSWTLIFIDSRLARNLPIRSHRMSEFPPFRVVKRSTVDIFISRPTDLCLIRSVSSSVMRVATARRRWQNGDWRFLNSFPLRNITAGGCWLVCVLWVTVLVSFGDGRWCVDAGWLPTLSKILARTDRCGRLAPLTYWR